MDSLTSSLHDLMLMPTPKEDRTDRCAFLWIQHGHEAVWRATFMASLPVMALLNAGAPTGLRGPIPPVSQAAIANETWDLIAALVHASSIGVADPSVGSGIDRLARHADLGIFYLTYWGRWANETIPLHTSDPAVAGEWVAAQVASLDRKSWFYSPPK